MNPGRLDKSGTLLSADVPTVELIVTDSPKKCASNTATLRMFALCSVWNIGKNLLIAGKMLVLPY